MENAPYKELFYRLAFSPGGSDESIAAFESFKSRMDKALWHGRYQAVVVMVL